MNRILKVDYYDDFKCTADKCKMNCCEGSWTIYIDKKTFKKYKALKNDMGKEICSHISYVDRNNYDRYGKIDLNCNGGCSLKDKNGLCTIHRDFGEEYLSDVCKVYPRSVKLINGDIEYGLDTSCPEVCNMRIIKKDKISFNCEENDIKKKKDIVFTKQLNYNEEEFNIFWNIRSFIIEILQFDDIPIGARLIAAKLILSKIDGCKKGNEDVDKLISSYRDYIGSGDFYNGISEIEKCYEVKIKLLLEILEIRKTVKNNEDFDKVCEELEQVFNYNDPIEEIVKKYKKIEKDGWEKFTIENNYIFENFIVNNFYNEFNIDGSNEEIEKNFFKLVLSYCLLKFLLLAELSKRGEISEEKICEIMAINTRIIDHDDVFVKSLKSIMNEVEMDSMAYLTILLME